MTTRGGPSTLGETPSGKQTAPTPTGGPTPSGVTLSLDEIGVLDRQIEQLGDCRSLPESEIKALCERVRELDTQHDLPVGQGYFI